LLRCLHRDTLRATTVSSIVKCNEIKSCCKVVAGSKHRAVRVIEIINVFVTIIYICIELGFKIIYPYTPQNLSLVIAILLSIVAFLERQGKTVQQLFLVLLHIDDLRLKTRRRHYGK